VLIRTDHPDKYRGANAVILKEMVQSKFQVISAIQRLMLWVAVISALAAVATVINLARVDASNRRSEFGILKALGAGQRTVYTMVSAEFGVLALLSAGLGLAGSLGLAWGIIHQLAGTAPSVDITGILAVFATTAAAYAAAGALYHFESKRQYVIRELRGE
ncbi:MAG TPA: FtsX-like permease family protein, partial [bacterium]|nr:FtsX-like permease family protein [bacterium]